jgi:hypothetical protein
MNDRTDIPDPCFDQDLRRILKVKLADPAEALRSGSLSY